MVSRVGEQQKSLLPQFLELVRFSHTVFALPFSLLGFMLACVAPRAITQPVSWSATGLRLIGVLLCMVTARSAAMAFNRLVDAEFDAKNPRTSGRHLPTGQLSRTQVWIFFVSAATGFIVGCLLFLPNWLPIALALPVLGWICSYSLAKRFTANAHLWLGLSLALAPICAWIALRGEEVLAGPNDIYPVLWLGLAIAFWVTGFDIIYACQDADFDRQQGLYSVPARVGVAHALKISALFHAAMLLVLAPWPLMFPHLRLGILYWLALAIVAILIVVEHRAIRANDLSRVNFAFFKINSAISLGFCSVAMLDTWIN